MFKPSPSATQLLLALSYQSGSQNKTINLCTVEHVVLPLMRRATCKVFLCGKSLGRLLPHRPTLLYNSTTIPTSSTGPVGRRYLPPSISTTPSSLHRAAVLRSCQRIIIILHPWACLKETSWLALRLPGRYHAPSLEQHYKRQGKQPQQYRRRPQQQAP